MRRWSRDSLPVVGHGAARPWQSIPTHIGSKFKWARCFEQQAGPVPSWLGCGSHVLLSGWVCCCHVASKAAVNGNPLLGTLDVQEEVTPAQGPSMEYDRGCCESIQGALS